MKIITNKLDKKQEKIINYINKFNKNILILDIETTGFSRKYAHIYMIGCIYKKNNNYIYTNIFATNSTTECDLIMHFYGLLKDIDCIVSYNGNSFDIPFLVSRSNYHNIEDKISSINSIDIYDLLRPFRHNLNLPNLKLDTIQKKLGYKREDSYNGGELINIYKLYTNKPYKPYYDLLLLHNKEDVEGMINLLPLIDIIDVIDNIEYKKIGQVVSTNNDNNKRLEVFYKIPHKSLIDFKIYCNWSKSRLIFSKSSNIIKFIIPIYKDSKKYFFNNYKDYVYVPSKKQIIHKSLAQFMPADKKEKVNKSQCYISKNGYFIPLFTIGQDTEVFKDKLTSKEDYVLLTENLNKDFYKEQLIGLLNKIRS